MRKRQGHGRRQRANQGGRVVQVFSMSAFLAKRSLSVAPEKISTDVQVTK
jgi:hypothetical protein